MAGVKGQGMGIKKNYKTGPQKKEESLRSNGKNILIMAETKDKLECIPGKTWDEKIKFLEKYYRDGERLRKE